MNDIDNLNPPQARFLEETKEAIEERTDKPLFHWCQANESKVHIFDWTLNAQKSISLQDFKIPCGSRSIAIDFNNILLCGGKPNRSLEINKTKSKGKKPEIM